MSLDIFVQDGQDPKIVEKIYGKIIDMLPAGETVKYIAVQKKPAVTLLPDCIIISNRRIFLCEFTKLGLSTNFEIFAWKDIKDIAFKEEIFGSKVTVIPFTGENLSIDYIPKTQARKLFQLIKDALENSNQEQTSIRQTAYSHVVTKEEIVNPTNSLVELYEASKAKEEQANVKESETVEQAVELNDLYTETSIAAETEEDDEITNKLKKLKNLYDKQLISQSEYENKKAEILEKL